MAGVFVKDARRIGVYGASGSGKSTCVKGLLRGLGRVVVFDPMDEYRKEGATRCTSLKAVLAALRKGWARGFRIAYVPPAMREPEYLHKLALLLIQAQRPYLDERDPRKVALVVEELNMAFPVSGLPRELSGFPELCSRGRHYGIEIFGVAQRLAEINTRFRGNTEAAYFFRQGDHRDFSTAVQMLGPAWRDRLKALQNHEFLRYAAGQVEPGKNVLKP